MVQNYSKLFNKASQGLVDIVQAVYRSLSRLQASHDSVAMTIEASHWFKSSHSWTSWLCFSSHGMTIQISQGSVVMVTS